MNTFGKTYLYYLVTITAAINVKRNTHESR